VARLNLNVRRWRGMTGIGGGITGRIGGCLGPVVCTVSARMSGAEFSVGLAVVSINTAQHESLRGPARRSRWGRCQWGTINPPDAPGLVVVGSRWVLSVPRLFLCVGVLHPNCRQCTSSVRVHRHVTGAPPPCLWRVGGGGGGFWGGGVSGLGLSSVWSTSWCLCGASCCGSSEMSHVIPRYVFQTLKSHRWNSAVFSIPMKS